MEYDLVFEGGGAKGMVFVGALQVFESFGHTVGRLLGTSAGAITAAMLAAGYRSAEMLEALAEKQNGQPVFAGFLGIPSPFDKSAIQSSETRAFLRRLNLPWLPDRIENELDDRLAEWLASQPSLRCAFSFLERGGWYSADNFLVWLRRRLDSGVWQGAPRRFSGMTLAQFYIATHADLSLVAADTTSAAMLVLNHRTAPDLPLVWAVRMSMSVPLLWQEVVWQSEWGAYRGREMVGHAIVDGGLLSNFPIELFVSNDETVTAVMGPKKSENVLGFLIDESLPVPGAEAAPPAESRISLGDLRAVQRLSNLVNTTLSARDKWVIDAFENRVVRLPARGYGTTEFNMSAERQALLLEAGRQAMQVYFDHQAAPADLRSITFDTEIGPARVARLADQVARKMLER